MSAYCEICGGYLEGNYMDAIDHDDPSDCIHWLKRDLDRYRKADIESKDEICRLKKELDAVTNRNI